MNYHDLDNTSPIIHRPLPRMRTPRECYEMIHEIDPQSRVSETYIRSLAKCARIPAHKNGRGYLINFDALLDYLANPTDQRPAAGYEQPSYGTIRPVPERG